MPPAYLAQFVPLLHLAQLVQVAQPGRHIQPLVHALLGVRLGGGQFGASDGELHAGFLIGDLLARRNSGR